MDSPRTVFRLGLSFLVIGAIAGSVPAEASAAVGGSTPRVGMPWRGERGITETVREIIARDRRSVRTRPGHVVEEAPVHRPAVEKHAGRTSAEPGPSGTQGSTAIPPTPGVSFLAVTLGEALAVPPDTMGSVGPDQILVHTNGRVKLFDKTGTPAPSGTPLDVSDDAFWASVRAGFPVSDPHVEYDRLSGRWFLTIINIPLVMGNPTGPNRILVAVSSGSTITNTSSFTFFQFEVDDPPPVGDTNRFADYPTLGVDRHALYIGANLFNQTLTAFANTSAFVIDKVDLLANTLTVTAFRNLINPMSGDGPWTPQAVHNQDPGAAEGYFIGVDFSLFDELQLLRVTDPGGTPSLTQVDIAVPPTAFPMGTLTGGGVPQPGPEPLLDDIDDRLYAAMIARNPAGQLRLWTAHNIEVDATGAANTSGNRDGSRWYEIGNLTGTPSVVQSGTLFDPSISQPHSYWMPSIAASGQGHALIGSSRAGANATTGFAGAAVAERLAGDTAGTLSAPLDAQSSTFPYDTFVMGTERWGDYSQTVIDPNDNMTFWTFQEYTENTDSWGVRVIQLKAPPPADPSAVSPSMVPSCASVDVEVTGTSIGGSGFFDPGPDTGGPGFANHLDATVDGGVTVNGISFTDPTHVTVDVDTSAASAGTKGVTITNPDGQSDSTGSLLTVTGTDTTAPAAFNLETPANGATVGATPTLTWQASSDTGCGLAKYQLWIDGVLNRDDISATSTTPVAPLTPGGHTWKIVAVDAASPPNSTDSTETRSFTVDTNAAPVLNAIGNKSVNEGQTLSFQISATDADSDPLVYSASKLPSGATFAPATQTFSWTPGFNQAGVYPGVQFEVTDGTAADAEEIQITVGEGTLGPKQVALKAKPKKVEQGARTRLTATVAPCAGHQGDSVDFYRGSKKVASKASSADCVAKLKVRVKKTARYQAVSPVQDDDHLAGVSNKVKVRVI